jgi:hypothetical protein
MTFFICEATGLLGTSYPWSMRMITEGTASEAASETAWDDAIAAMFGYSTLLPYIPTTTILTGTSTSTASATFTQTTKTSTTHDSAGTSTSPSLPYHVCEILSLRTAYATRWGRGRVYFPPLATNAVASTGGTLLAAAITALADAWEAFFTGLGSTLSVQILHRRAPLSGAVAAYSTTPVNSAFVSNMFDTQRRRADKFVQTYTSVTV